MPITAEQIVSEIVTKGFKSNPFDKIVPLLKNQRDQALPLALLLIERVPKGGTFFDTILSHLTEQEFNQIIEIAVARLESNPAEILDSVFAYAALQFPKLLTPHLSTLFRCRPNEDTYYEDWPWRGADDNEVRRLQDLVTVHAEPADREKAWLCLVETRRPDCIEFAARTRLLVDGAFPAHISSAGFDPESHPLHKLHSDTTHHIIFPENHFEGLTRPPWTVIHPTWTLEGGSSAEFGGITAGNCGVCGGPLHRMLRSENAQSIWGIQLPQLELCTCLSCLGWEAPRLFFSHNQSGAPTPLNPQKELTKPQFPATPLKPATVRLAPTPPRWQFQDWALSNSRENLHRTGGAPCWIQDAEYPACPKCDETMRFITQLDSYLPTRAGKEWLWGSGGIAYFFWCDTCNISASACQCT